MPPIIRGKRFNRASDYQAKPTGLVTHDLILIKGNKVMKLMFIVTYWSVLGITRYLYIPNRKDNGPKNNSNNNFPPLIMI